MGRQRGRLVAMGAGLAVTAACSGTVSHKSAAVRPTKASGGTMRDGFSETAGDAAAAATATMASGASTGEVASGAATAAAAGAATDAARSVAPSTVTPPNQQAGALRAGSVDDNARFAEYLAYREAFAKLGIPFHQFDVSERHVFTVRTPSGAPVTGAGIVITDRHGTKISELRTYADGRALWFPLAAGIGAGDGEFNAAITRDAKSTNLRFTRAEKDHTATLDVAPA